MLIIWLMPNLYDTKECKLTHTLGNYVNIFVSNCMCFAAKYENQEANCPAKKATKIIYRKH